VRSNGGQGNLKYHLMRKILENHDIGQIKEMKDKLVEEGEKQYVQMQEQI
jgi:hypothetical protein